MSEFRRYPVPDGLVGLRADAALARLTGLSRTTVAAMLDAGDVLADGRALGRSERLAPDLVLDVTLPDPPAPLAVTAEPVAGLEVIHLDPDLVVVDKPVGVAAHPSPGWSGPTVLGGLAAMRITVSTSGAAERQGIVQRLDVGTTGVMVVARSEHAYSLLKNAFRHRTVDKEYTALVQGHPDPSSGTINAPIARHRKADYKFTVRADGRDSITHYETIEAFRAASLVKVVLETGRTHQIRVHFSALRHPLVGDLTYGADPTLAARLDLTRQWLHARAITFAHPKGGRSVTYTSEYPADLARAIDLLRGVDGR